MDHIQVITSEQKISTPRQRFAQKCYFDFDRMRVFFQLLSVRLLLSTSSPNRAWMEMKSIKRLECSFLLLTACGEYVEYITKDINAFMLQRKTMLKQIILL